MNIFYKACALILFLNLSVADVFANKTAEQKGLEIAIEMEKRDRGWGDVSSSISMYLKNRKGAVSERSLEIKTLEIEGDGDKSLSVFHEPRDVKGTAFLSFSHALKPDQQWLFLPALKRVKRISSSNKSGPFLGSEIAFEDMASFEIEKFKYEFLREEELDGEPCYVVKFYPQYKHSGYTHQEAWIHKNEYRPEKTDFYDRKGDLLKTLRFSGYQKYLDKFWRADSFEVVNHQTGKSTQLLWKNYVFNSGLSEKDFTQNALKRAR